jgi:hypothetical protein
MELSRIFAKPGSISSGKEAYHSHFGCQMITDYVVAQRLKHKSKQISFTVGFAILAWLINFEPPRHESPFHCGNPCPGRTLSGTCEAFSNSKGFSLMVKFLTMNSRRTNV